MSRNIVDREILYGEVLRRKQAGQTVVFTNGCFDLLHVGHVRMLRQAATYGSCLIVAVNSDASVRRLKGPSRPINSEATRTEIVAELRCVDAVTIFDEDTPHALIDLLRPHVLVKGGDYRPEEVVGREIVEGDGGILILIPLVEGHSTTNLVQRAASSEIHSTEQGVTSDRL